MKNAGLLAGVALGLSSLGSAGCVSAEQHRTALADLQRLRMEAWQRSVEAAALRIALDRASAENAQLRAPGVHSDSAQTLAAVASRLEEVAQRQDAIVEEMRSTAVCAPAGSTVPATATGAQAAQPRSRKVTDLLYSRF